MSAAHLSSFMQDQDVLGELLHSLSQPLTSLRCSLELSLDEAAERYSEQVSEAVASDDSAAMVRAKFADVHLIENKDNRGFAAANNQGFAESHGRYVLMLNPDTAVRPGALDALAKKFGPPRTQNGPPNKGKRP